MPQIPVTFAHEGKEYSGYFDEVNGMACKAWHLMIDKFYWGRLRFNDQGWFFDPTPKDEWMKQLAGHFGEIVSLWYQ